MPITNHNCRLGDLLLLVRTEGLVLVASCAGTGLDLIHASSPRCIRRAPPAERARERQGSTRRIRKGNRSLVWGVGLYCVSAAACARGHGIGRDYLESTEAIKRLCLCLYGKLTCGISTVL